MRRRRWLSTSAGTLAALALACGGNTPEATSPTGVSSPTTTAATVTDGSVEASPTSVPPSTPGPVAVRPDGLTGAPLPPPDAQGAAFDEDRFFANAGTFPALTDPEVVAAADATWLEGDTLVLGATQNGEARAYPIFQLRFHHVANDVLGGEPYLVTF